MPTRMNQNIGWSESYEVGVLDDLGDRLVEELLHGEARGSYERGTVRCVAAVHAVATPRASSRHASEIFLSCLPISPRNEFSDFTAAGGRRRGRPSDESFGQ